MTIGCDRLKALFARWGHLEDDKEAIQADLAEMFKEAKAEGFNPRAMRAAFRIARKHGADGAERELSDRDETDAYLAALGIDFATRACAAEAHSESPPDIPEFMDRRKKIAAVA